MAHPLAQTSTSLGPFVPTLEREWRRSLRCQRPLSLLVVDAPSPIDEAFDRLLEVFALDAARRATDTATRSDDGRVALVLADTSHAGAAEVANRLLRGLASVSPGSRIAQAPRVGIATCVPEDGAGWPDLLRAAMSAFEVAPST